MRLKEALAKGPVNYRVHVARFEVVREPGAPTFERPLCSSPGEAAAIVRAMIPDDGREHFIALYLNAQNRMIAGHVVSVGTATSSLVNPAGVFGPAMRLLGVASVIVAHNHPSGDTTPSPEDRQLSHRLAEGARLLDLRLHDSLVVGSGSDEWRSLASEGAL